MKGWSNNIDVKQTLHRFFFHFWHGKEVRDNLSTPLERAPLNYYDFQVWKWFVTKSNGEMAPQTCEVLQTLVWWGGGGGHKPSPHHTNICKISQLAELYLHLLKTFHFQICQLLILRRFFQWCRRCFPNWSMSKVKNRGSSKAKNGILFDWKQFPVIFDRFYLHVIWVQVYFFCN